MWGVLSQPPLRRHPAMGHPLCYPRAQWVTEWTDDDDLEVFCVLPFVPSKRAEAILEGLYRPERGMSEKALDRLQDKKERAWRMYISARRRYSTNFRQVFEAEWKSAYARALRQQQEERGQAGPSPVSTMPAMEASK